jgi:release factor glutamine methyltransferase
VIAKYLLADAIKKLRAAHVDDPQRDARILLALHMGISRDRLTLAMEDEVSSDRVAFFDQAIARRAARVPVSQILGVRSFFGRDFRVTSDVLDPRPDTETLVQAALAESYQSVLDLGTGSGCILLTLLAESPAAHGFGTDVSALALGVATKNAAQLGLSDRSTFYCGSWFEAVDGQFDLIVSNPPYIAAAEMNDLQPEVRLHEPRIALTDEADGLTHYRHIIAHHDPYLTPGGRLMVEIGPTQAEAVSAMMAAAKLTEITVIPDLDGRNRVVWGRKPRKTA